MEKNLICDSCQAEVRGGDLFCLNCGKIVPNILTSGNLAIEIPDVPSAQLRKEILHELKKWFPGIDPITAENRLRKRPWILVSGIDERSANRLLEIFKSMKIDGRLVHDSGSQSWLRLLWNPGLTIAAGLITVAALVQSLIGFIIFLFGAAAPFVWAFWKSNRKMPLLDRSAIDSEAPRWIEIANQYSKIISKSAIEDAELLRSLMRMIIDLQQSLKSRSLVSIAAGEDRGDLYTTLNNSSLTAIDLCRRINSSQGEERDRLRRELQDLLRVLGRSHDQLTAFDREEIKSVEELTQEIDKTVESIDRIIHDIRSPLVPANLASDEISSRNARHPSLKEFE